MGITALDHHWMMEAMALAHQAKHAGEVPVGAVLVDQDNQLIGAGFNRMIAEHDPTAHAELNALREGAKRLQNYRLEGTTLYVTLEPCSMCAGAMVHARIQRLIFATRDFKTGAAGSVCNAFHPHVANHRVIIDEGVLQEECARLLTEFFKSKD